LAAPRQKLWERIAGWLIGAVEESVDSQTHATVRQFIEPSLNFSAVTVANHRWLSHELLSRFQIVIAYEIVTGKVEFIVMKNLGHDNVVATNT
jgi:hypothetical protein